MTSHEYAKKLRELAVALESKDDFVLPDYQGSYTEKHGVQSFVYYDNKDEFLAAVKAVGSGTKRVERDDLHFIALSGLLRLTVNRSSVCRLIKPAEYKCDPLLSQEEEATLGSAT